MLNRFFLVDRKEDTGTEAIKQDQDSMLKQGEFPQKTLMNSTHHSAQQLKTQMA